MSHSSASPLSPLVSVRLSVSTPVELRWAAYSDERELRAFVRHRRARAAMLARVDAVRYGGRMGSDEGASVSGAGR